MTGYTFELVRVVAGVQLVTLTLHQFDENDYKGRIFSGECPAVPALIDGVIVDAPQAVKDALVAEAAQAEALRKATPEVIDHPLELPSLILQTLDSAKGAEIFVSDTLQLAVIEAHASPLKAHAARLALAKQEFATLDEINAKGKAGVNGQLQARIENLERLARWRP